MTADFYKEEVARLIWDTGFLERFISGHFIGNGLDCVSLTVDVNTAWSKRNEKEFFVLATVRSGHYPDARRTWSATTAMKPRFLIEKLRCFGNRVLEVNSSKFKVIGEKVHVAYVIKIPRPVA